VSEDCAADRRGELGAVHGREAAAQCCPPAALPREGAEDGQGAGIGQSLGPVSGYQRPGAGLQEQLPPSQANHVRKTEVSGSSRQLTEMWQFYNLDVRGKLVAMSHAVRHQLMTPQQQQESKQQQGC
jgi:hypothetical protein